MLYMSELREYGEYLRDREMSENTVGKYLRDAENFLQFSNGREISRELMMEYKSYILNAWKISSVNSMITAVNSYLKWAGQAEFSIHTCRVQKQIFREKSREAWKGRILQAVKCSRFGKERAAFRNSEDNRGDRNADR